MHLAVCHSNRTFPLKEFEQEPQNRFSSLPTARPYPLTSDPWHTSSCIGWVQASDVWVLRVLHFCVCPKLAYYSCVRHGQVACLHILPSILDFLWYELFTDLSLWLAPVMGLGFVWLWVFFSSTHYFAHFCNLAFFAVMLFDPSLLGLFGFVAYSSLDNSIWSLVFLLHGLQAPASHLFPPGRPWPIYFPWASSAISNSASP